MTDFKATRDLYIPLDNVDFYVSYNSRALKSDIRKKLFEGNVMDFTGGKKTNTVVYLKSGKAILLYTTLETIFARRQEEE